MRKKRKGQSTLEYIILVAGVIAIAIGFLVGDNAPFRTALNGVFEASRDSMVNMTNRFKNAYPNT